MSTLRKRALWVSSFSHIQGLQLTGSLFHMICWLGEEVVIQETALANHPWASRAFWNILFMFPLRNHLEREALGFKQGSSGRHGAQRDNRADRGRHHNLNSFSQCARRTAAGLRGMLETSQKLQGDEMRTVIREYDISWYDITLFIDRTESIKSPLPKSEEKYMASLICVI